ncbi:MAG TPA: translocation/assembly module TamB domain-containing protein, partial [Candidatus Saccharimonadales bacterium]|nr:translocation/assembly module TamB domain-containing protein [Candidatus Saccharimonadales bacterium]
NGMGFDSLRVLSRGRLGSPPSATADVAVTRLRAGDRPLGDLVSAFTVTDHISIDRFRESLGDTTLTLRGNVRHRGQAMDAALDSVTLAIGPRAWRNVGPVQATLLGDRIDVTHLSLATDGGRVDLAGNVRLEKSLIEARARLQGVDIGRTLGPADSTDGLRGVADGDLLVSGSLADPEIQANLRVFHPRVGGIDGDSLAVALGYAPGALTVTQARWVRGAGSATLAGTARPQITFQEWMRALTRRDHTWTSKVALALQVRANAFDLASLAPIDTSLSSLRGVTTGTVRVTGSAESPVLALDAQATAFAFHGVDAESVAVSGGYAGRKLTLERLDFTRGGATSRVEGFLPMDFSFYGSHRVVRDQPLSIKLRMTDADFGVAALFIPEVASSAGKLNVTADLRGTLARPLVTGALRLTDGTLRVAGRDEVLEKAEVDASFDEHRVNVTRIAAVEGKRGKIAGTGWWQSVEGKHWGSYEFKLHATEFTATDRETYMFRFTGDFLVKDALKPGGEETYRITSVGPAQLIRGELTMDLSQPREDADPTVPFLYEIAVDVPRNLWYRNLDTEVELQNGQLTLQNEGYRDQILGSLDVKGKYYIYSNEFRILNGTISFTSLDRIDPDISIEAQTTVRGQPQSASAGVPASDEWPIYQTLSGKASQLKVHLHDDHGSGENYLWKILTIGQFLPANEQAAGSTTAAPDATLPVRNYLFRNAERWLADVGFIDTIDLKSGTATSAGQGTQTIGQLGVGKYVTPELYVKYSRDFSATAEQQQSLSAEYRVTRHLLLRGEQFRTGPVSTASTTSNSVGSNKQGYNLDLKVRLEY